MNKVTNKKPWAPGRLVVVGGGAAGFFCAVNAARIHPGLQVTLVEKSNKLLSKVKVSGGGRCNVTHACFDIADMSKRYPRGGNFVKKAFHQFFTTDTIEWFEERGVKLKTEKDGRMFPVTDSSQTIIDCLLKEADKYGVKVELKKDVTRIETTDGLFTIHFTDAPAMTADRLCIACGGFPKSFQFNWITELGHTIEEPVPSLFTFNIPGHPITKLMGISVESARVKIISTKLEEQGPLLVTHWGLSGPVVLKLSAWGARELAALQWNFRIKVNWLPEYNEQQFADSLKTLRFEKAGQFIENKNPFGLPQRLWEFLLEYSGIKNGTRWADLPAAIQNKLVKNVCGCELEIKGKTTFKEEFVTAGGIKLNEIDPNTMMSKKLPGLFFAGEIMDVDGVTGGFNFQHAWTSGYVAATAIGKAL
jgi:predicted Rossmann fold flavoprotein